MWEQNGGVEVLEQMASNFCPSLTIERQAKGIDFKHEGRASRITYEAIVTAITVLHPNASPCCLNSRRKGKRRRFGPFNFQLARNLVVICFDFHLTSTVFGSIVDHCYKIFLSLCEQNCFPSETKKSMNKLLRGPLEHQGVSKLTRVFVFHKPGVREQRTKTERN